MRQAECGIRREEFTVDLVSEQVRTLVTSPPSPHPPVVPPQLLCTVAMCGHARGGAHLPRCLPASAHTRDGHAALPTARGLRGRPEREGEDWSIGRGGAQALLETLLPTGGYCIGKTKVRKSPISHRPTSPHHLTPHLPSPPPILKVFFKGSKLPTLEARRLDLCANQAVRLQAHARRRIAARFFHAARGGSTKDAELGSKAYCHAQGEQTAGRSDGRRAARARLPRAQAVPPARAVPRRGAHSIARARSGKRRRDYVRKRSAAIAMQKNARMRMCRKAFHELLEKARVQARSHMHITHLTACHNSPWLPTRRRRTRANSKRRVRG